MSAGYSLVELLAVFAIISVLIAAAVPGASRLQKEWALWGGTRLLESSLQWGRMHAISSNSSLLFEIDENRHMFCWKDPESGDLYAGTVRILSNGLRITAFPRRSLRFYQHGNAAPAGTYTVEGDTGSYSVVVAPGGRIRIQRN